MYAVYTQRKMDPAHAQEARQRAEKDFFPKLQQAPGFVSFHLIQGDDGANLAVVVWESRAAADAFRPESERWFEVLDQMGHQLQHRGRGEVLISLRAQQ